MQTLSLPAYAKLNLTLQVLHKRSDSFHEIKTVFERINLCDHLTFKKRKDGKIKIFCDHPGVPTDPKNFVWQVAELMQKRFDVSEGVTVTIDKRIPVAAGLAGGSSNAATAIKALNHIWNLRLSDKELLELGVPIGSDVCFFLHNTSFAIGKGRGEVIQALAIKSTFWHILVVPKVVMKTPKVYGALDLKGLTKRRDNDNIFIHSLKNKDYKEIQNLVFNDLEGGILRVCPRLEKTRKSMQKCGIPGVTFSGSGPSIFGLVGSQKQALDFQKALSRRYQQVFAVKTF